MITVDKRATMIHNRSGLATPSDKTDDGANLRQCHDTGRPCIDRGKIPCDPFGVPGDPARSL